MRGPAFFVVLLMTAGCGGDDSSTSPGKGGSGGQGGGAGNAGQGTGGGAGVDAGDSGCAPQSRLSDGGLGCNSTTGIQAPLPVCTAADACTQYLPLSYTAPVTTPTAVPSCKTTPDGKHPEFTDPPPLTRPGIDGTPRYACLHTPTPSGPRPLLVYFHPSGSSADVVYQQTLLRQKAESYGLAPGQQGFALLSIQARNLHFPTTSPQEGSKFDIYYRDFSSCSTNPDFAAADGFIDDLVAGGGVDPKRIYVSGWSNGARFAQAYAIARHEIPTPAGHRVAAAAVWSGADPFNNTAESQSPSCQLDPYPKSTVPIFTISGWCDLMPCNDEQAAKIAQSGELAPGSVMPTWLSDLATKVSDPNVTWTKIRGSGELVTDCMPLASCSLLVASAVHTEWPDGIPGTANGAVDHEPAMLDFLRDHPL